MAADRARQVTNDDAIYKYHIEWSPDSKKILWADKDLRLRFVNVETGEITEVCKCDKWEFSDYAWSPDSQWIVYTKPEVACMSKIYLYSLKDQTAHELTDGWYDSSSPVFSSDGQFVFFVSDRDFNPDLQPDRMEPRLSGHVAHLPGHAGESDGIALQAARATRSR